MTRCPTRLLLLGWRSAWSIWTPRLFMRRGSRTSRTLGRGCSLGSGRLDFLLFLYTSQPEHAASSAPSGRCMVSTRQRLRSFLRSETDALMAGNLVSRGVRSCVGSHRSRCSFGPSGSCLLHATAGQLELHGHVSQHGIVLLVVRRLPSGVRRRRRGLIALRAADPFCKVLGAHTRLDGLKQSIGRLKGAEGRRHCGHWATRRRPQPSPEARTA
mmetsp:Transcript_50305/g.90400  ORF Transcript_50305/g.90400 Transcript_50305/m.90400 type:complete len:214 (+) Transcript_50305:1729-2370(+)